MKQPRKAMESAKPTSAGMEWEIPRSDSAGMALVRPPAATMVPHAEAQVCAMLHSYAVKGMAGLMVWKIAYADIAAVTLPPCPHPVFSPSDTFIAATTDPTASPQINALGVRQSLVSHSVKVTTSVLVVVSAPSSLLNSLLTRAGGSSALSLALHATPHCRPERLNASLACAALFPMHPPRGSAVAAVKHCEVPRRSRGALVSRVAGRLK